MDHRLWRNFDWTLLATAALLSLYGLLLVASATAEPARPDTWGLAERQALWIAVGVTGCLLALTVDYRHFLRWSSYVYGASLALLVLVQVMGKTALGARRWLDIGPFAFQPSEFAKLFLVITLASLLARHEENLGEWQGLWRPVLHVVPVALLVLLQPDLGTSLVFGAILLAMLYMAGVPGARLVALVAGGAVAVAAALAAHFRFGLPVPLHDYQIDRLLIFLNPMKDPLGDGYHIIQSMIAIGSGQLYGQGLFQGSQSQLNYLPENHTDFIFAVLGEELGLAGGLVLLFLYLVLLWRGLAAANQSGDLAGSLLVAGVCAMLGFHMLVNIGMTIGIMPVTGLPLPLVSYGGSAMLTDWLGIGLILNVRMRSRKILF